MYDLIFVLTWCSLQDPVKPSEQQNGKSSEFFKVYVTITFFFVFWNLHEIMTWKKMGPNPVMFSLFLLVKHNTGLNL